MDLVTYKKYNELHQVEGLTKILQEHKVPFFVAEDRESLDSVYGDKQFTHFYFVKIKKEDFETVDKLLLDLSDQYLDAVEEDHYLFTFGDDELYDILAKPDEWSAFDFALAKRLLKEHGKPVDQPTIQKLRDQRIRELSKPEKEKTKWVLIGYFFSLAGGLLGVFIGWHLITYQKILPDGEKMYGYTTSIRKHGQRILILGMVMIVMWTLIKIFVESERF